MNGLKYIVFENNGYEEFLIFNKTLSHEEVAKKLCGKDSIKGAGFCSSDKVKGLDVIRCFGNSVSLNVKSRKEDSKLLTKEIFGIENMMTLISE